MNIQTITTQFVSGQVLTADQMEEIRSRINELINWVNEQKSGGGNAPELEESDVFRYVASTMKQPGVDATSYKYVGEIWTPSDSNGYVLHPRITYGGTPSDLPNIYEIHRFGDFTMTGFVWVDDTYVASRYTNESLYQNPGKYFGNTYKCETRTQVDATNYDVRCYMFNSNFQPIGDSTDSTNYMVTENVPSIYQILNDPDLYSGNYQDRENYLTDTGTSSPIVERYSGKTIINNAIMLRSEFTYGGTRCAKDTDSTIKITGVEGDMVTDKYTRLMYAKVQAAQDSALALIVGVIRDPNGSKWASISSGDNKESNAANILEDALQNDFDPKIRYIYQMHNMYFLNRLLYYLVWQIRVQNDTLQVFDPETGTTVNKSSCDIFAEHVFDFITSLYGPAMPWESSDSSWARSISLKAGVEQIMNGNSYSQIQFTGSNWGTYSKSDVKTAVYSLNKSQIKSQINPLKTKLQNFFKNGYSGEFEDLFEEFTEGFHISTMPPAIIKNGLSNLALRLEEMSVLYYEQHPTELMGAVVAILTSGTNNTLTEEAAMELINSHTDAEAELFLQTTRTGRYPTDYRTFNFENYSWLTQTINAAVGENITRLAKLYAIKDYFQWQDMWAGCLNVGQLSASDLTVNEGDIFVFAREQNTINNHTVADVSFNNDGITTLSLDISKDPWATLDLDEYTGGPSNIVQFGSSGNGTVNLPYQETLPDPNGISGSSTYGRFGGNYTFAAFKAARNFNITQMTLGTLYTYHDTVAYTQYAKVAYSAYRGYPVELINTQFRIVGY